MKVEIKAVKSKKTLKVDAVRLAILNELRHQNVLTKRELEKGVSTWDEPPIFESEISLGGREASAKVFARDEIYKYINDGTSIRWAVMSKDWRSKTDTRSIMAGPGRGHVVIAGRRAMEKRNIAPRPGIAARHFTQKIAKARKAEFREAIKRAIEKGMNQ